MDSQIRDLERDIEETRAKLDHTIDRLQDRLSVTGIMDDMLGTARGSSRLSGFYDEALAVVRRNPVPVVLIVAGIGLLLSRLGQAKPTVRRGVSERSGAMASDRETPVLNTGGARAYDPDLSPRHPTQDNLESRRDISARA